MAGHIDNGNAGNAKPLIVRTKLLQFVTFFAHAKSLHIVDVFFGGCCGRVTYFSIKETALPPACCSFWRLSIKSDVL